MFDVDVHIIRFNEPDWMIDRCLDSLKSQPVKIHIVKGVKEYPPFKGREKGFSKGSAVYASFVDPDDLVAPDAFASLLEFFGHDIIWGNEEIWHGERMVKVNDKPHHAYLIRRNIPNFILAEGASPVFCATFREGVSSHHVDRVLYRWNESEGYGFKNKDWFK